MQKWFMSAKAKRYRTIDKAGYNMGMVENDEICDKDQKWGKGS
jgi:hypothetical protein